MNEGGEALPLVEPKIGFSETACGLAKRADAVCSGNELQIGFLEKASDGRSLSEGEKEQQAQHLADELNKFKDETGKEILGRTITADEIKNLSSEIQKLLGEGGKFAGIFVNVLGGEGQDGKISALVMVTFLDYVKAHPDLHHVQLLKEAYQKVEKIIAAYRQQLPQGEKADYSLAAAFVDKDGKTSIINTGGQEVTIFDKNGGQKGDSFKEKRDQDGMPTVQSTKMENGEKIVLCSSAAISKIDGTKKVGEIVSELVNENHSAEAGKMGAREASAEQKFELEDTRAEVIKAFNQAWALLEEEGEKLAERFNQHPNSLTHQEKQILEAYSCLQLSLKNANEDYQQKIEVKDASGKTHYLKEGVPVDGLIEFLTNKKNQSSTSSEERQELDRLIKILTDNSRPFNNRHKESFKKNPSLKEARIRAEALFRFQDPYRRSLNPDDNERMREDWLRAEGDLRKRRELILQKPTTLEEVAGKRIVQTEATAAAEGKGGKRKKPEKPPPGPVVETPAQVEVPPVAFVSQEPSPGGPGKESEGLTPAPTGQQGEGQPAPVVTSTVEAPTTLIFGAYTERGRHAVQQAHDLGFSAEACFEELFRNRGILGGRFAITDRLADRLAQFGFKIKKTVPIPLVNTVLSLPFTLGSNCIRIARHPIKSVVRGFFKPFFDQQNYNFGADVQGIVQQAAKVDPSIPVDIPEDLAYLVLKKGSELRNKGFFRKIKNNFLDLLSDLSLGHIQTSEQREGKKWLREQLALPEDQRDQQLKTLWQNIRDRSLEEQDAEGQRFALLGFDSLEDMRRAGFSLEDVNRRVLAEGRETRHSLADVNPQLYQEANIKIKSLIEEYAKAVSQIDPKLPQENQKKRKEELRRQLLEETNKYLIGENYPGGCLRDRLPDQYQKEFSGFQVASNIIFLADKVAEAWNEQGYLKKDENGQTIWEKTKLDILFGRGEWHGRRGGREYGKVEGLFGLQERILENIAKQKLGLREGSYTGALRIANSFLQGLKELGTYGGAFALGLYASGRASPTTALSFTGISLTLAPVAGLAALRERGVDIPWLTEATGFRIRGRLELDRDRLSRQMALLRTGEKEAIVRQELAEALVKPVAATDLIGRIEAIIGTDRKGKLDPQKASQLLLALAEADARLGMTDRSGRKEMKFRVQNFVSYTQGKEGEEYLRLKQALLDGQLKLLDYLQTNPQVGQQILPGQPVTNFTQFSQAFEKVSALAKAQLVEGSGPQVAKKIERWLRKYGQRFGINEADIPSVMTTLFPKIDLEITHQESLAQRERNWFWIRNTRAIETFLTVVAGGLTTGQIVRAEIGELRNLYGDIQQAKGILPGIAEYGREWGEVLKGDVPLELDSTGHLVVDASFAQKGVLLGFSLLEKPPFSFAHQETIDGFQFQLPGNLRLREVDLDGDGVVDHRAIVDVARAQVVLDMSDYHLKKDPIGEYLFLVVADKDLNGDGEVNIYDSRIALKNFNDQTKAAGIVINRGPDIAGPPKTVEVIKPTGMVEVENPITHQKMEAPTGVLANGHQWQAKWVQDGTLPDGTPKYDLDGIPKYDLKVIDTTDGSFVKYKGRDAILVDNARFDAKGHLIGYDQATSLGKMIETPSSVTQVSEVGILTPDGKIDPSGELGRHMQEMPPRHWHTEHQFQFYNFKNEQGNVVLDFRKCGGDGVFISFGGDPKHGFFLPDGIDGKVDGMVELNPQSNAVIPGSDGFTLGQLTETIVNENRLNGVGMPAFESASEFNGMQDLFNLAVGGKKGFIEAVGSDDGLTPNGHIYATITGTGALPPTIEIPTISETLAQRVNVGTLTDVVSVSTPTFIMTAPPIETPDLWVIPIPIRPSLERSIFSEQLSFPQEPLPVYYPYYPSYRRLFSSEWEEQALAGFSPRLKNNPTVLLKPEVEIPWYLEQQRTTNPEYYQLLQQIDQQVKEEMNPNCKMAVCIAVAGHQEYDNIYRTLQTLAVQQDRNGNSVWNSGLYEVILLVNWPQGASLDDVNKTLGEIEKFKAKYRRNTGKDFPLRVYTYEVTNGKKELGLYKKIVFDLALLRHNRVAPDKEIYLVMNDADMKYASLTYLDGMLRLMEDPKYQRYDAILGRQDLDPSVYKDFPTFHVAMRFWQFLESIMRAKLKMIGTQGRNTVIRGSSYAAIGGNRTREFWADIEFGELLKLGRRSLVTGITPILYSNANWVMVHPRREIDKFLKGEPIAETWFDFNTREVRGKKINFNTYNDVEVSELKPGSNENKNSVSRFDEDRLKKEIQRIVEVFGPVIEADKELRRSYASTLGLPLSSSSEDIVKRALGLLGIEANVSKENGQWKIEIQQTTKLRERLEEYHAKQRWNVKIFPIEKRMMAWKAG